MSALQGKALDFLCSLISQQSRMRGITFTVIQMKNLGLTKG